jgi:oxygen-independent coproporphyrinogen-3 oxidase
MDIRNLNVPRYTSYPVITYWNRTGKDDIKDILRHLAVHKSENAELYVHLPFCESLCTYCGCNKYITKNHEVEDIYLQAILKEWEFRRNISEIRIIRNIHLGGGTPTFFSALNLHKLLQEISTSAEILQGSVEAHPHYTTKEQLKVLYDFRFNKISLGVQDFDPKVQRAIHRIQTAEQTRKIIDEARTHGYKEINIDLVYGLPHQTLSSVETTLEHVLQWKPESISYFSYAHVPWKSKAQRGYDENDIPGFETKRKMFRRIVQTMTGENYLPIGMDHFALPGGELAVASKNRTLRRNFMGYSASGLYPLVGLGCSSISDLNGLYLQNTPDWKTYCQQTEQNIPTFFRHHFLSEDDVFRRDKIMELMGYGEIIHTDYEAISRLTGADELNYILEHQLADFTQNKFRLTEKGKEVIRWVASCFDPYFKSSLNPEKQFSKMG